jgi:hypothetical protein
MMNKISCSVYARLAHVSVDVLIDDEVQMV